MDRARDLLQEGVVIEAGTRLIVGIGELIVSNDANAHIVTHALGSCIAVCLFDPVVKVAAMLHFLLPEAKINAQRAHDQPAAFADTGIPLLFQSAYTLGLDKKRARVSIVGGAETNDATSPAFKIGRRNALAAKNLLWRNGVMLRGEEVGGSIARTVHLHVGSGRVQIFSGRDAIGELQ
jgi:chemotaxis protein CheD